MSNTVQAHIQLTQNDAANWAILPGDWARVDRIKNYLEDVQELAFNREFKSIRGTYKGVPVLAVSTGIGGASMGICCEELHNIGVKGAIRIGSAGAYVQGIGLGDLIIANGAVRDDGASNTYAKVQLPAVPNTQVLFAIVQAAKQLQAKYHVGIVRSHDSFYTDQELEICDYWGKQGVLGADLETAALLVVGGLRGMMCGSILNNVVLAEGDAGSAIGDYVNGDDACAKGEELEILTALEAIVALEKNN